MNKAYKFEIYPTEEQETIIQKTFGCTRFVYNWALAIKRDAYINDKNYLGFFALCSKLTKFKEDNQWLMEVSADALQNSIKNMCNAYERFFKSNFGYPKFKSKKNCRKSYTETQNRTIKVRNNQINIPRLKWVNANIHREIDGRILNCTVSQTPSGKYYCSIVVDFSPISNHNENQVGIDLGIKDLAILSDGTKFSNPHFIKKSEKNLRKQQKKLSKMQKGSNNYEKQRIKVAKIYEHITNQRKDYLHNITRYIANNYGFVALETLNSKGLMKNHHLAKAISDVSWCEFNKQLEYKMAWSGGIVVHIDRWYPSSQICSVCGHRDGKKALNIREWVCPMCGAHHDRDINASINILNEGKRLYGLCN